MVNLPILDSIEPGILQVGVGLVHDSVKFYGNESRQASRARRFIHFQIGLGGLHPADRVPALAGAIPVVSALHHPG